MDNQQVAFDMSEDEYREWNRRRYPYLTEGQLDKLVRLTFPYRKMIVTGTIGGWRLPEPLPSLDEEIQATRKLNPHFTDEEVIDWAIEVGIPLRILARIECGTGIVSPHTHRA